MQPKKRRLHYDRSNIPRAFEATQKGMSVYKAAMIYNTQESNLRDCTTGKVELDGRNVTVTMYTSEEEQKLVGHI